MSHKSEFKAWAKNNNKRRFELIDKEISKTINPEEQLELNRLQDELREHKHNLFPLPLKELRKLRDEILEETKTAG